MRLPLAVLATSLLLTLAALADPEPGTYTGIVKVTRALFKDGLFISNPPLRAVANVKADGSILIVTAGTELPGTATLEGGITRAVPRINAEVPPDLLVGSPLPILEPPVLVPGPAKPLTLQYQGNYVVDGKYGANLEAQERTFRLSYQNPPGLEYDAETGTLKISLENTLQFEFTFRKDQVRKKK